MELIGQQIFMEVSKLTEEEYKELKRDYYILPMLQSDTEDFYTKAFAEKVLLNKEKWLQEIKDHKEYLEENKFNYIDDEIEHELTIDQTYNDRDYGKIEDFSKNELDLLAGISDIDNFEEEEVVAENVEKNKIKRKRFNSKKSYKVFDNGTIKEAADQNTGTKEVYKGLHEYPEGVSVYRSDEKKRDSSNYNIEIIDFNDSNIPSQSKRQIHNNLITESQNITNTSSIQSRENQNTFNSTNSSSSIDEKYRNYEKYRESLNSRKTEKIQVGHNYEQNGHLIKNVDYSSGYQEKKKNHFQKESSLGPGIPLGSSKTSFQDYKNKNWQHTQNTYNNPQGPPSKYQADGKYVNSIYHSLYGTGNSKSKPRMQTTMSRYLFSASSLRSTEAYQGFHNLQSYGGKIAQGRSKEFLNKRAIAHSLYKMNQNGFNGNEICNILESNHLLNQHLKNSIELGINSRNVRNITTTIEQYFRKQYGIDLKRLTKKELNIFMRKLSKKEVNLLNLFVEGRKINVLNRQLIQSQRGIARGHRLFRQKMLSGLDAYDGARMLSRSLRSAKAAMYVARKSSIFVGKQALKLSKKLSPKPVEKIILRSETDLKNKLRFRKRKIQDRKIHRAQTFHKVKQTPKKILGKGFRKVFKKSYSETSVGRITGTIGKGVSRVTNFFDRIFSFFNNISDLLAGGVKKIILIFAGFLLALILCQALITVATGFVLTIQSFFETSDGKSIDNNNAMDSAGGKILTTLINKDEEWLDKDVYGLAKKTPSQIKGSKVYGGTDPNTGSPYEIKEFGVSDEEINGVNFNFYDGNGYVPITGKTPDPLLGDTPRIKKKATTIKKQSTKMKTATNTYKGDPVVFASRGEENDGISKKFVGTYRTTGYCAGCNSPPGSRATSSGVAATPGVTIAIREDIRRKTGGSDGSIYFIDGHYYILQDKCGTDAIDIYVSNAKTCAGTLESAVTAKGVKTYLVSSKSSKPQTIELKGKKYTGVHITEENKKKWLLFDGEVDIITGSGGIGISGIDVPVSNAKAILSMGTVYFDQEGYYNSSMLQDYCIDLWNASHKVKANLSDVYQCPGCKEIKNYKCSDKKIKDAKGPNGRSYGLLDGISVHKDSGCKKYYCNEDKNTWQKYKYKKEGCSGKENQRGSSRNCTLTIAEINQYPKLLEDQNKEKGNKKIHRREIIEIDPVEKSKAENIKDYKAKCTVVEMYTESKCSGHYGCPGKHSKKYCPGHVDLNVNACIVGIDENEAVQLYQIDPGEEVSKIFEYKSKYLLIGVNFNWENWTKYNRQNVEIFYQDDWKDTYNIDIESLEKKVTGTSSTSASSTLSAAERKKILNGLPKNLSSKRRKVIEWSVDAVGRIPYHFGDVAQYPGYEKNNFGSRSWPDYKGRNKKGLDCAKFVDWVYWSTINNNLGNGPTSTLRGVGKETNSLKPGDIVVRGSTSSGAGAHTGIFIGYNSKNQMIYVHESSSGSGNVMVSASNMFAKSKNNGTVTWRNMDYLLK